METEGLPIVERLAEVNKSEVERRDNEAKQAVDQKDTQTHS